MSISGGACVIAVGDGGGVARDGAGLGLARATCLGRVDGLMTDLVFCGGVGCLTATGLGWLGTNLTSSGSCGEFACTSIFCRLGRKTKNNNTCTRIDRLTPTMVRLRVRVLGVE